MLQEKGQRARYDLIDNAVVLLLEEAGKPGSRE